MSEPRPRPDYPAIAASAAFAVGGALALWYSRDFSPLGSVFPRTMAVVMILLSAVYVVVALARPKAPKAVEAGSPARRIALAVTLLAWALLLERVGFLVTSACAFAVILVIANYDRWTPLRAIAYVAASALLLGGLYAVFRFVLQVPFPQGMLV